MSYLQPQLLVPEGKRRVSRFVRFLRAVQRDTTALLREFHRPLIVFLVATIGGGILYWIVMGEATPRPPLYDMPYIMLSLMVLGTPLALPTEPYLIVFWYLMPVVAVYVIGRGVTDFVRLFFNRNERRAAWEEAVASTYRNHIIVMGAGHVGIRITRTLVAMGFDVVMIDIKLAPEVEDELRSLKVPAVLGDGRMTVALEKAGLLHAEAFIACTSEDQVNLEAILGVRDMHPTIRIVARMWDDRFAKQIKKFMGVNVVLSASDLAAPVFAGSAIGLEITQTLTVHGKEYSMIRLTVEPGSFMDGRTIGDLQDNYGIDIVLHGRGEAVNVHPRGEQHVRGGDTLVVFSSHDKITNLVAQNRRTA